MKADVSLDRPVTVLTNVNGGQRWQGFLKLLVAVLYLLLFCSASVALNQTSSRRKGEEGDRDKERLEERERKEMIGANDESLGSPGTSFTLICSVICG